MSGTSKSNFPYLSSVYNIRGFALCKQISLVLKPSASEMRYITFHVKIDKLQTMRLWTPQICVSLSLKALEAENKLAKTTFPQGCAREV